MECTSCKKRSKDDVVLETKFWSVVLSSNQAHLGRCYITLNRHCGDLAELHNDEWSDYIGVVKRLESALKKAFDATMFNWTCLMNNAYQGNPPNPHVHWHFRPRYNKPVELAGEMFEDPEFGHHYDRERKKSISSQAMNRIRQAIKDGLKLPI